MAEPKVGDYVRLNGDGISWLNGYSLAKGEITEVIAPLDSPGHRFSRYMVYFGIDGKTFELFDDEFKVVTEQEV